MASITSVIREDAQRIVKEMGEFLQPLCGTTLLLTGAAGFLCSYVLDVVDAFNRLKFGPVCRVMALDNFITGLPDRVQHLLGDSNFQFIQHDVTQPVKSDEPIDWILHGAGIASPTFYRLYPRETIDVNVNGTRQMLDLARQKGVRSMLYLSTSEIYGDPEPDCIPTNESYRGRVSCTGPRACYDESKRLGETICSTYYRLFHLPVKTVRPFNVYGPGQRLDDRRIIPDLMSAAVRQEAFVLYSDGRATRSFCYIRDFIRGMLYVMLSQADGEAVNVGNNEEVSINSLAEYMVDVAAPPRLPVEFRFNQDLEYLTDNPQRRCPDLSKLCKLTPYLPEVRLVEGLTRTLQSYREIASAS
jgi:dTDP-glucose 4,6-dehydratase/UDP-glucuronate decarboxylase